MLPDAMKPEVDRIAKEISSTTSKKLVAVRGSAPAKGASSSAAAREKKKEQDLAMNKALNLFK